MVESLMPKPQHTNHRPTPQHKLQTLKLSEPLMEPLANINPPDMPAQAMAEDTAGLT